MKKLKYYFTFLILVSQSTFAAEPAFEAYYKYVLGGQHAGYVIQRYEVDAKKNEMTSTYYIYVKTQAITTTESLVAKADLNFEPKSYQYSAIIDGKAKFIDATFANKRMTAKMVDNSKTQNVTLTVPANGFMSAFLNYVVLKNGMMVGKNYDFYALAEEAPACFKNDKTCKPQETGFIKGSASVKAEQKVAGIDAFKIDFNYKGVAFSGFISAKGETLGSISPLINGVSEIVKTKAEAVGDLPFKEKHIVTLFGGIPAGIKNSLYEKKTTNETKPSKGESL